MRIRLEKYENTVFIIDSEHLCSTMERKFNQEIRMKMIEVYNFVKQYKRDHNGNSPSYYEIMQACNISSKSTVTYYLTKLQDQGYLEFDGVRSITIPNTEWQ